jgi:hypothetical protein
MLLLLLLVSLGKLPVLPAAACWRALLKRPLLVLLLLDAAGVLLQAEAHWDGQHRALSAGLLCKHCNQAWQQRCLCQAGRCGEVNPEGSRAVLNLSAVAFEGAEHALVGTGCRCSACTALVQASALQRQHPTHT